MHVTGGFARERSRVRVVADGAVHAFTGTQSNGHGHETSFAQVAAKVLQLPARLIRVHQGDTAELATGGGTGGSSSTIISANTLDLAARAVIDRGTRIAARVLEAAEADIDYDGGVFTIAGTDRRISLFELARRAEAGRGLPPDLAGPLQEEADFPHTVVSCPAGAMACEVEVDPETGIVSVERLVSVQDIGTVINAVLVDGQVHGGIAQSLGQALLEHVQFDAETGALLTSDYMSYALPRAVDVPRIDSVTFETPSPNNRLGIKGVGELCTIGAPAAIINAVVDALGKLGVRHIDMPATPERVWRAIAAAGG
jgi:carbon-monoxide dehydrogenase large subunit